jgi:hypothetical protein
MATPAIGPFKKNFSAREIATIQRAVVFIRSDKTRSPRGSEVGLTANRRCVKKDCFRSLMPIFFAACDIARVPRCVILAASINTTCRENPMYSGTKRIAMIVKSLAAVGAIGFATAASAGSTIGGVITSITTNTDLGGIVFINTSVAISGSCDTGSTQWVLPLSSALDNQIYAQLLMAFATQSTVSLYGDSVCNNTYNGVETLVQVAVQN